MHNAMQALTPPGRPGLTPAPWWSALQGLPPQSYFLVSAVFHYLGPAFAVLLFAHLDVLGVAWLRIAAAAALFAAWRRPWRLLAGIDRYGRVLVVQLGVVLAAMNAVFYLAVARLPLATVAAIEFLGVVLLATVGVRTPRNAGALALTVCGVAALADVRLAGQPLGFAFAFGNCALFVLYVVVGHRIANTGTGAMSGIDQLGAAMLVAAVVASKLPSWVIRLSVLGAIVGIVASALALFGTGEFGNSAAGIVALLYVLLTPPAIAIGVLKQFREKGNVTVHSMFGVLCLYLLIGLLFAVIYAVIQQVGTTDFFTTKHAGRDDFLYFSYATLTTVGYGDLVAASNLGRSLAITEALLGQIYLVTVVALIVSRLRPAARPS